MDLGWTCAGPTVDLCWTHAGLVPDPCWTCAGPMRGCGLEVGGGFLLAGWLAGCGVREAEVAAIRVLLVLRHVGPPMLFLPNGCDDRPVYLAHLAMAL